jgi:outer membrane protein assembly factor BamB
MNTHFPVPGSPGRGCFSLLIVFTISSLTAVPADWPHFMGPGYNNISGDTDLARSWPAAGPKVLWETAVGEGYAGPSIAEGKVYLLDRKDKTHDVLRCIDFKSGDESWRYAYDAPGDWDYHGSRTTPAIDGNMVYTVGPLGHIHCINTKNRKPVWKKNLLDDWEAPRPTWAASQSPLVYKDLLIVAPMSEMAGMVAYHKLTGELAWKSNPLGGSVSYVSPSVMKLDGRDQILIATSQGPNNDGGVRGIDPETGMVLWSFMDWQCNIAIPQPIHLGGGRMFVTGGYGAGSYRFQVTKAGDQYITSDPVKIRTCDSQLQLPIHFGKHIYANSSDGPNGIVCLDEQGELAWKSGRKNKFGAGPILIADDLIFALHGDNGVLVLLEAKPSGFMKLGEVKLLDGPHVWAPMAMSGGKLLIRDKHKMKCLDVTRAGNKAG